MHAWYFIHYTYMQVVQRIQLDSAAYPLPSRPLHLHVSLTLIPVQMNAEVH